MTEPDKKDPAEPQTATNAPAATELAKQNESDSEKIRALEVDQSKNG